MAAQPPDEGALSGPLRNVQSPFLFPCRKKKRFLESKEKGAPVRVRWSQIVIRRPVFTPPLRSSTGHSLRRWNRENRWFYPTFFRRLRRWGSVRGAAPRYSLFTLPYSLFLFFAGRGFPDAPRTTLLFSVILRPQAEESASPVPGRHKIGRGKRIPSLRSG